MALASWDRIAGVSDWELERDLRPAVLIDRSAYRLTAARARRADQASRARWLSALGALDVLTIIESDRQGRVPMNGREFAEAWNIGTVRTWFTWQSILVEAGALEEISGGVQISGMQVQALETLQVGERAPLRRASAIDPMRYRLGVQKLTRLDPDGRRWWMALGAWGLMRFVEADPSTRVVPYSASELAETYGVDPRTWGSLMSDLLEPAGFGAPVDGGCERRRAIRRAARSWA